MKTFTIILAITIVVIGASFVGIVGFHYPMVIQDEPLTNPIKIKHISENKIVLENGDILKMSDTPRKGTWNDIFKESDFQLTLEGPEEDIFVLARQNGWICGTPWAQLVTIPLIPDRVYRNRVEIVGSASLKRHAAEQDAAANP